MRTSRRDFLKQATAASVAVPAFAQAQGGAPAATKETVNPLPVRVGMTDWNLGQRGDNALLEHCGGLHRIGGPVDVAGGWFDAGGGYENFAYTSGYANGLMLLAARDFPGTYPALAPEAGFGLGWLEKLWNPARKVLYVQAGIGTGNASNTIQGDYNFWFLPQAEDRMDVGPGGHPGPTAYYVKYRPVFQAAPPGKPISPDLAGRMAANFALGA